MSGRLTTGNEGCQAIVLQAFNAKQSQWFCISCRKKFSTAGTFSLCPHKKKSVIQLYSDMHDPASDPGQSVKSLSSVFHPLFNHNFTRAHFCIRPDYTKMINAIRQLRLYLRFADR